MSKNFHNWVILISWSFITLVLSGCSQAGQPGSQPQLTQSPAWTFPPTASEARQSTPTITLTNAPTLAASPIQPITLTPLATRTQIYTPTWTPAPTLSAQEALDLVENMEQNNGGCRLPCWWGMVLGKTAWDTQRQFLETLLLAVKPSGEGYTTKIGFEAYVTSYSVTYPREGGTGGFGIYVIDNVIECIQTGRGLYPIHRLLVENGKPDEVYVKAHWITSSGEPPPFHILLDYRSQGFWAHYELEGQVIEERVRGCPQSISPFLELFSPEWRWTTDEMFTATFGPPVPSAPVYPILRIVEATGMDLETFYRVFKEPDNKTCLETSNSLWPPYPSDE